MAGNLREEGQFIQTGNPFTVNEATPFAQGQLGKVTSWHNSNADNGVSGAKPIEVQYVKRRATQTAALQQGGVVFWEDTDNFVITGDPATAVGGTTAPLVAGAAGGTFPAAGSYGYIEVGGISLGRVADSTSAVTIGAEVVWSTDHQVQHPVAGTQTNQEFKPPVGILRTLNTATGTNLTVELLLTVPRNAW